MKATETIPAHRFHLWLSIFKKTSGRFLSTPVNAGGKVWVSYEISSEDCVNLNQIWYRLNTPIIEKRRHWIKRLYYKCKGWSKS